LLKLTGYPDHKALNYIAGEVKSGDTTNEEAKAAKIYWKALFGESFIRDRYGMPPNPSLNFGYAVLRAAVARSLVGSGMLPTLGIHHHNRYNAYCLADDIMEPYRPFVDKLIWKQKSTNPNYHNITNEIKADILGVLVAEVLMKKKESTLMISLALTTASLAKCFEGKNKIILYPDLVLINIR
jgi:CRISPR-associated protein Cas1